MTSVLIIFEMTGGYGFILPLDDRQYERLRTGATLANVPIYEALLLDKTASPAARKAGRTERI